MSIININSIFTDQLISALCDTLLYSLLQGVALAATAGLIVVLTRKASPAARYNLLIGALVLFTLGTCITFAAKFGHAQNTAQITGTEAVNNLVIIENVGQQPAHIGLMETLTAWLNTNHNVIVLIWFLIICAKCIQLATGLQGVYRLKNRQIFAVPDDWQGKMTDMAERLDIKQKIALLESGLAKVPMVIGHLKPVILIPVGLLTALTTAEVEAILLHELAHIRRRDYLVNLLQSLVEIVFFFNPAVLWVSQLIKTEREHCCDDMALAQNANKSSYIMALVSCEQYQQAGTPAYAMAFPGAKNHLLSRVKRMAENRNHSLNMFEKTLLTICLVTAGLCFSAYAAKDNIKKAVHVVAAVIKHQQPGAAQNNVPKVTGSSATAADAKAAGLVSAAPGADQTAKLTPTLVDTTSKVTSKFRIYRPEAIGEGTELQVPNAEFTTYIYKKDGTVYQLNLTDGEIRSVQINGKTLSKDEATANKADIDRVMAKMDRDADALKNKSYNTRASLGNLSGSLGQLSVPINIKTSVNTHISDSIKVAVAGKVQPSVKISSIKPVVATYYPPATPAVYHGEYDAYKDTANYVKKRKAYTASASKSNDQHEEAIDDMMKDGLISSRDNLSFKLSSKEFIVNYKKMPEDIYQKYRAKYVKVQPGGDWTWMYNFDTAKHQETNTVIDNTKN